ncbi:ATP-binding protein [Bacteroides sp. BFG-551]|nr:ATP-binding protein [Bacteroides sp. BFG-551]
MNHYDKALSFNDLPGVDKSATLVAMARDTLNDLTIVGNVADFIAGTYTPEMIQDVRHNRQGVILIANDSKGEDLKEQMLKLFGLYVDKGYYKVSFPREQRYAYYDVNDPDALKKLCGTGGLIPNTRDMFSAPGPTDDPSAPEVTARALHAMKKIYISNRFYVYTSDYKYHMTGYESLLPYTAEIRNYVPRDDKRYDGLVDREWTIDVYNLRIYAPTNGDNMIAVYSSGGNGFSNRLDNSLVSLNNPPMYEVWALIWGLRNNAYTKINIRDGQRSQLNLKLIDFAPGLPETESTIGHSYSKSVGFDLGVSPVLKGDYCWGKSITYQLSEMTREVTRTITDAEMEYCWKWYPETLFRGSKAMKANGMIDGAAMISPAWYDILYDHVAGTPGTDNVFCDYDNDLQFNQNLLNYQQECAITARTTGASAGVVAVEITDGMALQRGGAWFTSWGQAVLHPLPSSAGTAYDTTVDVHKTTTVWIDYNNW